MVFDANQTGLFRAVKASRTHQHLKIGILIASIVIASILAALVAFLGPMR